MTDEVTDPFDQEYLDEKAELYKEHLEQRLNIISEMCIEALESGRAMLNFDFDLLRKIQAVATEDDTPVECISKAIEKNLDHVIVSCDASITVNPGGQVAVGVVIQYKDEPSMGFYRKIKKSNTNNQGEYDAVYFGITQLMSLKNNPGCLVEVRSDSKLVVDQLNGKMKCNDETLMKKRDNILELVRSLPVPVVFQWRPRNSTPALEEANNLAQSALGVSLH